MVKNSFDKNNNLKAKNPLRNIISIIVSFLLALFLTVLTALLVIGWSGFYRGSFYNNMSKNNYYDNVVKEIQAEAESLTLPIGLPLTVLDGVFSTEIVSRDVNGYIDASFHERDYTPNMHEMEEKLERNAREALNTAEIRLTKEQENNLQVYQESIRELYMNKTQMPFLSYFINVKRIFSQVFIIGLATSVIGILICLFFILKLYEWIHHALRYITYSTLATGLMVGIVPGLLLKSGFYKRIHLAPEYFYHFFTDYVTNILVTFLYFGVVWIIISLLIIASIGMLKKRKLNIERKTSYKITDYKL